MGTKWTQADVDRVNARISGAVNDQSTNVTAPLKRKVHHMTKTKYELGVLIELICKNNGWELVEEFKFLPDRKFRFDWCIPHLNIGVEYEGTLSDKSRHTSIAGYTNDCRKYTLAALAGWKVLRYTALNYQEIAADLQTFKNIL